MQIVNKIAKALIWRFNHYFNKNALQIQAWYVDHPNEEPRYDYKLNKSSLVFDVGGYEGKWSNEIYQKFNCKVWIFEPHPVFYKNLLERFSGIVQITVFPFGLGSKTEKLALSDDTFSSSIFKINDNNEISVEIKNITEFLQEQNIEEIDLMKINIEGAEYELLESLIKTDRISSIKNLQVQFHNFVDNAYERMTRIKKEINKTHNSTYAYRFVWDFWERKF